MKIANFDVLIEENKSINTLASGCIVLPNIGSVPMAFGRVVQVGPGRTNKKFNVHVPASLAVDDIVVYNPGVAKPIKLSNGKQFYKISQNEAIAVLEEESGKIVGVKKVMQNYMLVRRDNSDMMSLGGIVIPEINRTIDNISGTVYMAGPGKYDPDTNTVVDTGIAVGEKVSFCEVATIQLTLPVRSGGEVKTEKFYEIPASMVDFVFKKDKDNSMTITKIKDKHVLVKRSSTAKTTSAGIYLPDLDTEGHMVEAEIIMVGDKCECAKAGDKIIYIDAKENNRVFKLPVKTASGLTSSEKCYMIPETDIEAWLDEDETL